MIGFGLTKHKTLSHYFLSWSCTNVLPFYFLTISTDNFCHNNANKNNKPTNRTKVNTMPTETELKLRIAPEDAEKLLQHPLLLQAHQTHQQQPLYNTYFDTPERDFLKNGIGMRVRRKSDGWVQTVKSQGQVVNGLHQREEWEVPLPNEEPDLSQVPDKFWRNYNISKKQRKNIVPIFTTDFVRTTWNLYPDDTHCIEVALDLGEVRADATSLPLHEVELELKAGTAQALYQIALELQESIPLTIENHSKAQRGYSLSGHNELRYYKAGQLDLQPDMTVEIAFSVIAWACLEHLQLNEDMVLFGEDIEGVHQMRVAIRRLRSALSVFTPIIPKSSHLPLREELRYVGQVLGEARDWDVFALNLQQLQQYAPDAPLQGLRDIVQKRQQQAYVIVREVLCTPRYSRLLLRMGHWLSHQTWQKDMNKNQLRALNQPVGEFAAQLMEKHYRRVCKRGKKLMALSNEKRHEFRIDVKKMGYGTRFFTGLYTGKTSQNFVKNLTMLQDELGILNDTAVARDLLNRAELSPNDPARHFLMGWYTHQQISHMDSLKTAWQQFLVRPTFW